MISNVVRSLRALRTATVLLAVGCLLGQESSKPEPFQRGHTRDVTRVSLSPDATKIASYSAGEGELRVWDIASRRALWSARIESQRRAAHSGSRSITGITWSGDGEILGTGTTDGNVTAWRTRSGEKLWSSGECQPYVNVLAFNENGDAIACGTASNRPDGSVALLDARTGNIIRSFKGSLGSQFWIKLEGRNFISAGEHGGVFRRWDISSGKLVSEERLREWGCPLVPNPAGLAFSPDGKLIAFRCGSRTDVVETGSSQTVASFQTKANWTRGVKFSADGRKLAFHDMDEIRVVDLASRREVAVRQHSRTGDEFDLNRDGMLLAEAGSYGSPGLFITAVEDRAQPIILQGHPGVVESIAVSRDGSELAFSGQDGVVRSFDVKARTQRFRIEVPSAHVLTFSPDGTSFAAGGEDGNIHVVDRERGVVQLVLQAHKSAITAIAFSKAGGLLATGSADRTIAVWRISDGAPVRRIETPGETRSGYMVLCCGSPVKALTFQNGTTSISAVLENGATYTWSVQTGTVLRAKLTGPSIQAAVYGDKLLAIAPSGGTPVRVLDASTLQTVSVLGEDSAHSQAIALDAMESVVVTGDILGEANLWDARTGRHRRTFPNDRALNAMAISGDGTLLATGGEDQSPKLWSIQHGNLVFDFLSAVTGAASVW